MLSRNFNHIITGIYVACPYVRFIAYGTPAERQSRRGPGPRDFWDPEPSTGLILIHGLIRALVYYTRIYINCCLILTKKKKENPVQYVTKLNGNDQVAK